MTATHRFTLIAWLLLGAAACRTPAPQTSWRDDMAEIFSESSVRPDDPPRKHWAEADVDLLQRRLGYADLAAVGRTRVVSVYSTFNSARQVGLSFHPEEIIFGSLKGEVDGDGDLLLQLTPAQNDFRLAVQVQKLLPGTRYLVFLKREPRPGRPPLYHWALYRGDDPELLKEVRATYQALRGERDKK